MNAVQKLFVSVDRSGLLDMMAKHRVMKKEVAAHLGRHQNTITYWLQELNQDRLDTMTRAVEQIVTYRHLEQLKQEYGMEGMSNIEFLEKIRKIKSES